MQQTVQQNMVVSLSADNAEEQGVMYANNPSISLVPWSDSHPLVRHTTQNLQVVFLK